ncbi:hypothetical protein D3C75_797540 [compost metagenome]
MNANPILHFILLKLEGRRSLGRNRAGSEREADAPGMINCLLGRFLHLTQGHSPLRCRTGDLMHQDRTGHSSFPDSVEAVFHGNIIIDLHIIDLYAVFAGKISGILEIHHIAAVILNN